MKIHWRITAKRYGEDRARSYCGKSSGFVWNVETIENRQNLTSEPSEVTCINCKRYVERQQQKGKL